ncbi:MAG: DUF6452 family protein [Bacteroidota bacterium]
MEHNAFRYGKNHLGVIIALIFFAVAACEEPGDCTTDTTNIVRLDFIKLVNQGRQQEEDEIDTIRIFREGGNIFLEATTTGTVGLPLDPANDQTTLLVVRELRNTITLDTIVINYQREQTLISPECGPDQRFFNISPDNELSSFDSIRPLNPEVSQFPERANIQVFTCRLEMSNELQLRLNHTDDGDTIADTLIVNRVYANVGKPGDLRQNDTIPELGNVSVTVPLDPNRDQIAVFVEIAQDSVPFRQINVLYQLDTFQVPTCLVQDRYQIDSVWTGADSARLFDPAITEELLNINNPTNVQISLR